MIIYVGVSSDIHDLRVEVLHLFFLLAFFFFVDVVFKNAQSTNDHPFFDGTTLPVLKLGVQESEHILDVVCVFPQVQ